MRSDMTQLPRIFRIALPATASLFLLSACGGLLSSKPPRYLFNLTPASKVAAGRVQTGSTDTAFIVSTPSISQKLATTRIPVQSTTNQVAYLVDAKWVESPANLFQVLLSETITARTGKLVLNEGETPARPGNRLMGDLVDFGIDEATSSAIVTYDAVMTNANGEVIRKQRFTASEPVSKITADYAGGALNRAANAVAVQVADWVG
ncbi:ABC transporter [Pseudonocardia sp. TMWB2A]